MNTASLARSAYAQATAITPLSRDTEYRAFSEVTRQLAENMPVATDSFPRLVQALHLNQRLWTIMATDVADAGNGLPDTLRAQIFYLSEFTRLHTGKVLRKEAEPDVLLELNTAIMRGLRAAADEAVS